MSIIGGTDGPTSILLAVKKYVAFLRGINISGKNKISMADLKKAFIYLGFEDVSTVLNSGNIIFSAMCDDPKEMGVQISNMIHREWGFEIPTHVVPYDFLKEVLGAAPDWWGIDDKRTYDNIVFILTDDSAEDICKLIGEPSDGKERVQPVGDVIFWSYNISCYQKCNWWKKTATNGIAEKLTIRTGNTIKKICK